MADVVNPPNVALVAVPPAGPVVAPEPPQWLDHFKSWAGEFTQNREVQLTSMCSGACAEGCALKASVLSREWR